MGNSKKKVWVSCGECAVTRGQTIVGFTFRAPKFAEMHRSKASISVRR